MRIGNVFTFFFLLTTLTIAQEDYTLWPYHEDFILNTTSSGANVANNVVNFPVLIRLNAADSSLFSQAMNLGADIRFAKPDNTHLAYQIERWDGINRVAEIWVRVDTVYGSNNAQTLRMYWGRAGARDSSNGAAVFDTASGFVGVWHLGDALGGAVRPNAVMGGNAANPNVPLTPVNGMIGMADTLRGNGRGTGTLGDHFNVGTGYSDFGTGTATLSMWVKPTSFGASNFVQFISIGNTSGGGNGNNSIWFGRLGSPTLTLSSQVVSATTNANRLDATDGTLDTGQWQQVFFVVNGTVDSLYRNGGVVASQTTGQILLNINRTAAYIGRSDWNPDSTLKGVVDEVTISKSARSSDWVKLSFENQKQAQTLVMPAILPGGGENYSTWSHHTNVILNTAGSGANIQSDVRGFPVLIRLGSSDATIFGQSAHGGADLRFTKADNFTRIPHQIEYWDDVGKSAAIWVLVDTIKGNANNQNIRMHWGKPAAADSSDGRKVFNTSNGFQAVWHMDGAISANNEPDATSNGFTATQNNNPAPATGMIAGARSFDGAANYFTVVNTAAGPLNFAQNGNYTVSAWVNATAYTAHGVVVSKHDRQYALKLNNSSNWEFFEFEDAAGWNAVSYPPPDGPGTWEHLSGVWDGTNAFLYINGAMVSNTPNLTSSSNARVTTTDVTLGRQNETTNRYFNGLMDEIRLSSVSRDSNWVRLEFQNQQANQTLVSLSDTIPAVPLSPNPDLKTGISLSFAPLNQGMMFMIQTDKMKHVNMTLLDIRGREVWTHAATLHPGANQVIWNGESHRSRTTIRGVYMLHVTVWDAVNSSISTLDRKIFHP